MFNSFRKYIKRTLSTIATVSIIAVTTFSVTANVSAAASDSSTAPKAAMA